MNIEFDPDKDAINIAKHGVALAFGRRVWNDPELLVLPSLRPIDGEERYKAIGLVEDRLWTAVHVRRGNAVRMISVRRSNDGEQRFYDRAGGGSK